MSVRSPRLAPGDFALLLIDFRLPDTPGLRLLQALRKQGWAAPAIMRAARPSLRGAIEALGREVADYLPKSLPVEALLERVRATLAGSWTGNDYLWRSLEAKYHFSHVLSRNAPTRLVYTHAAKVARSRAPIVIAGESGTGKEFLARALHYLSGRAEQLFVTLNCGALPDELLESELFGHEKGAFTSAMGAKAGLCEVADGGDLFLDEIGDMSLPMQVKLLRFLNDGSFRRLGGTQEQQVDVRVLAATNQDLPRAVAEGRFREDLFWRLNVIPLYLPPLRERPEDLEPFSRHFLGRFARDINHPRLDLASDAVAALAAYPWPGNLRQLHNVLWRAALLSDSDRLTSEHLSFEALAA